MERKDFLGLSSFEDLKGIRNLKNEFNLVELLQIASSQEKASAHKAHKELDLAYNTTFKIYTKLRQCIYKFVSKDDQLKRHREICSGDFQKA
jgi:hypothetical protein